MLGIEPGFLVEQPVLLTAEPSPKAQQINTLKQNLLSIFKSRKKKTKIPELSGTCNHVSSVSLLSPRNWPSKAGHKTEVSLVVICQFYRLRVQ